MRERAAGPGRSGARDEGGETSGEAAVRAPVNRDGVAASERDDAGPEHLESEGDVADERPLVDGADPSEEAASDEAVVAAAAQGGPEPPGPTRGSSEDRERDRELVRRAQTGDQRAFRELFDRYHKRAFAVAFGVLKNKHDAMDVVQESFVKVHRHLDGFQGSSSFYTWLYRIVMNLAIDQLRRKKTARPVEYDDAIDREGALADEHILPRMLDANPRRTVIRRELMERVEAALATLPDYHRQVIVLREIEGLSYEEMAEILEVPKGTIMSRLFHARRKMQVALQDFVEGGDLEVEE